MRPTSIVSIIVGAVLTLGFAMLALVLIPAGEEQLFEASDVARAYSDLEARGRELYVREGCAYCHSQQVRSIAADRQFGTRPAEPGDYAYDAPHAMGRYRIGPDLHFVGDRHDDPDWYVAFLTDPTRENPHSMMPAYSHLSQDDLRALGAYLAGRQGGYVDMDFMVAEEPAGPLFEEVVGYYAGRSNPLERTADIIAAGGERYNTFCASCHGTDGAGSGPASMGMNPPPADFTNPKYLEAEDNYLAWRIASGVPNTMMPAWETALSEEQIWELVHYLRTFHSN